MYALFVLHGDKRINYRITFNSAKPEGMINFRTKDDPITIITGIEAVESAVLFTRDLPPKEKVWTICEGSHGIHNFREDRAFINDNDERKSWVEVQQLTQKYDQLCFGDKISRWWDHECQKIEETLAEDNNSGCCIIL